MRAKFLMTVSVVILATTLTSCSGLVDAIFGNEDKPVTKPVEYDTVFSYTYQGQTMYYAVDSLGRAMLVPPSYPVFDLDNFWTGYDRPKGTVVIPDYVPFNGKSYPVIIAQCYTFNKCNDITSVTLPPSLTILAYCAFYMCENLTEVTILSNIQEIEEWTFGECRSLTTVSLPEGITSFGPAAFFNCSSLTSINFPSTLKTIGDNSFYLCQKLGPDIVIPEGVTYIGVNAFVDCSSIESITLPEAMDSIAEFAFAGCTKLNNVVFPDNLSHVGLGVLEDCTSLTTCHLPAQMKYIDQQLFMNSAITNLVIPDQVTQIKSLAFGGCLSLEELSLPAGLTEIEDCAFVETPKLKKLRLASVEPPLIGEYAFDDFTATIIVPKGAGDAYRNHEVWGKFANIIED